MADLPIIFSASMIAALLAGRKTQTRRILKPEPASSRPREGSTLVHEGVDGSDFHRKVVAHFCPRLAVGDRLWVKETWQTGTGSLGPQISYRATGDCHDIEAWDGEDEGAGPSFNYERCPGAKWHTWLPDLLSGTEGIWRPSLFMPRWASRLTLLVTDVRVERLQDISEADAVAEGWPHEGVPAASLPLTDAYPIGWFGNLWDSINGPDAWDVNPWVAAISFKVECRNIDQLAPAEAPDIAGAA